MGINQRLEELERSIHGDTRNLKVKKWRLPLKAKVNKSKAKKNYVGILKINENGTIEPSKQQIVEQTIVVDGIPRLATADCVLRWSQGRKTFPVIALPSWSVVPINPSDQVKESLKDGSNSAGYKLLMNRMRLSTVETKKQMGGWLKWIILLCLAAIIGYAIIAG